MQSNNLRQEHQSMQEQPLLVSALGFGASIEEKLKNLLQTARPGQQAYALTHPADQGINILLVNYDNPLALQKKDILLNSVCTNAKVVAVSQGPLDSAPLYHIRGMLTASRLMTVFDRIPSPSPATALTQPSIAQPRKLELVQVPAQSPHKIASHLDASNAKQRNADQYRALVVDDSVSIQKSLELKLAALEQISGIDFADSGEIALAMAQTQQYDLIFLDVMMPGMDGYETCTHFRKKQEYKKTPIIMVSGKTSPLDEVKGIMAGCTTYLTKPVQDDAFQKLSTRVLTWLSDRKADEKNSR